MARPTKIGLDYFPLDVDIDQDDKIALIEADYGVLGFGIVIKLLMRIYADGYFYSWTDIEQKVFPMRINVENNIVSEVVNVCINYGLFDKDVFEKYSVLTSRGIQSRYLEATSRRKDVQLVDDYILVSEAELVKFNVNIVDVNGNPLPNKVNVNNNPSSTPINDNKSTQSKVKESKVKESKEDTINESVISEYKKQFPSDWVNEAVSICLSKNKGVGYLDGILKNFKAERVGNSSTNKNKFHNFKGQSEDYTDDELTKIALDLTKKRKELENETS